VQECLLRVHSSKICRISDPAATHSKGNLSLDRLPSLVDDVIRPDVEAALMRIMQRRNLLVIGAIDISHIMILHLR